MLMGPAAGGPADCWQDGKQDFTTEKAEGHKATVFFRSGYIICCPDVWRRSAGPKAGLGWSGLLHGDAGRCRPQARFAPLRGGQVAMLARGPARRHGDDQAGTKIRPPAEPRNRIRFRISRESSSVGRCRL